MENPKISDKPSDHQYVPLILTFCLVSVLFIFLVYAGNVVFGSTIGGWTYPYFKNIEPIQFWVPLAVLFLVGILIYIGDKFIHTYEKITLCACFLLAILIQVLTQTIYRYPMDQLIQSDISNSFYSAALHYSPLQILSQFQTLSASLPLHARTNMPGKILFFQWLILLTKSPQIMGYWIISISTTGGLLLYAISLRLFHDRTLALYSFVLYALIPCKQDFFPILNTITPVFILICLYFLLLYLDSKNKIHLLFLGVSLYLLALFEPTPFVIGILFLGILFIAYRQKRLSFKELPSILLIPTLAFIAMHLLFTLAFSFNLFQAIQYILKDAVEFNAGADRSSYSIWVRENLKEFFYGAGLPVMLIFIYFVISLFSQGKQLVQNILQGSAETIYTLSLLLTFSIVVFLGINRGETTRLWIYLAVFFQIPAAYFMAKIIKSNTLFFILAATLITQSFITLQRVRFLVP